MTTLRFTIFTLLLLAGTLASGRTVKTFNFNGYETFKSVNLNETIKHTEYRNERQADTCYRQVSYPQNICRNQTAYRRQCHITSPIQHCHMTQPRQSCYWTQPRQKCHYTNPAQICNWVPGKRVCKRSHSRRVCLNNPFGRKICKTIPGKRVCKQRPGKNVCKTQQRRRICRTIPSKKKCRVIPGENVCKTKPGKRVCQQVPYTKRVCHIENRVKQESYLCYKTVSVPYNVVDKRTTANVNFDFKKYPSEYVDIDFKLILNNGQLKLKAVDNSGDENAVIVINNLTREQINYKRSLLRGTYTVKIVKAQKLLNKPGFNHLNSVDLLRVNRNGKLVIKTSQILKENRVGLKLVIKDIYNNTIQYKGKLLPGNYQVKQLLNKGMSKIEIDLHSLLGSMYQRGMEYQFKVVFTTRFLNPKKSIVNLKSLPLLRVVDKENLTLR